MFEAVYEERGHDESRHGPAERAEASRPSDDDSEESSDQTEARADACGDVETSMSMMVNLFSLVIGLIRLRRQTPPQRTFLLVAQSQQQESLESLCIQESRDQMSSVDGSAM